MASVSVLFVVSAVGSSGSQQICHSVGWGSAPASAPRSQAVRPDTDGPADASQGFAYARGVHWGGPSRQQPFSRLRPCSARQREVLFVTLPAGRCLMFCLRGGQKKPVRSMRGRIFSAFLFFLLRTAPLPSGRSLRDALTPVMDGIAATHEQVAAGGHLTQTSYTISLHTASLQKPHTHLILFFTFIYIYIYILYYYIL